MLRYVIGALAYCACSFASASVNIDQFNPGTGSNSTTSDPVAATDSSGYAYQPNSLSSISVSPFATADLASAAFYDGMSYSGSVVCPGCNGALALYLPTLTFADSFVLSSSSGQAIPWSLSIVMTPQFGTASSSVFSDVINEHFSVGGNVVSANPTACFSINGGCGGVGASGPNNVPYTITVSGTINSGGTLDFISTTSGASNFSFGPTPTVVSDSFDLDPTVQLTVPQGVKVSSASGVFPVTIAAVPEPGGVALIGLGFVVVGLGKRRRSQRCIGA